KEIDAAGPANGAAAVLIEDEPVEGLPAEPAVGGLPRPLGPQEGERARWEEPEVGRDGAGRRDRHPEAAERRASEPAEEDVGLVVLEHTRPLLGMGGQPGSQDGERHPLARQLALVDQEPADAAVRATVGRSMADADLSAVGQTQGAAALDLHEED